MTKGSSYFAVSSLGKWRYFVVFTNKSHYSLFSPSEENNMYNTLLVLFGIKTLNSHTPPERVHNR